MIQFRMKQLLRMLTLIQVRMLIMITSNQIDITMLDMAETYGNPRNRKNVITNRVVKLALFLPVATATIERCFSKLKLVKTDLCNRIGPKFLNNAMVCAVKNDFLREVKDNDVMERFQAMKKKMRTNLLGICFTLFMYFFNLILYDFTVKKKFWNTPELIF
ncbi:hypothetical protein Hanom_Chr15g01344731 [Helianthus anomalus]